jgi:hypothetical protein
MHPPINFPKLPPIDRDRLSRALLLGTARLSRGQFRVFAPTDPLREPHYVDLVSADVPRCDCGDYEFRSVLCKHIIACLLAENHPAAAEALAEYLRTRIK